MGDTNIKNLQSIIDDLYNIDPSFREHERELEALVRDLVGARPEALLDDGFKKNLKRKLLASIKQTKIIQKKMFNFDIFRMTKFRYGLVGATLCAVIFIPIYFFLQAADGLPTMMNGSLVYSEGIVEYLDESGEWRTAEDNTEFEKGDSVKVDGVGKAVIVLDDGSVARLNSNTELFFEELYDDYVALENKGGDLYTRVAKLDGRTFDVKVDGTAYRALGTAYRTLNTDEVKGLIVYESSVSIVMENDEESSVVVEAGKAYYEENKDDEDNVGKVIEVTVEELKEDEFVLWNALEDQKIDDSKEYLGVLTLLGEDVEEESEEIEEEVEEVGLEVEVKKEETPKPVTPKPVQPVANISLSAKAVSSGIELNWTVTGVDVSRGFKVVKSSSINPVYPGDSAEYVSDSSKRSYTWSLKDGKTYYFRVCQYVGDACGVYSQNVKVTAPQKEVIENKSSVRSIAVWSMGDGSIKWMPDGTSRQGFKVVWSKNKNPTYPTRKADKYIYMSDPSARSATLSAFDGPETYYVRVCEYLGGTCGTYSSQVIVELGDRE